MHNILRNKTDVNFPHAFNLLFRKASTKAVKRWLQALQRNGVPVLVCLTHADMLYLECTDEDKRAAFKIELEVSGVLQHVFS